MTASYWYDDKITNINDYEKTIYSIHSAITMHCEFVGTISDHYVEG